MLVASSVGGSGTEGGTHQVHAKSKVGRLVLTRRAMWLQGRLKLRAGMSKTNAPSFVGIVTTGTGTRFGVAWRTAIPELLCASTAGKNGTEGTYKFHSEVGLERIEVGTRQLLLRQIQLRSD